MPLVMNNGTMIDTHITNNDGNAVGGTGAGVLRRCSVTASSDVAVSDQSRIEACTIYGATGVLCDAGPVLISDSEITGDGVVGILVEIAQVHISNSLVYLTNGTSGTTDAAIRVNVSGLGPMISNCSIRGSGANGLVHTTGTDTMIVGCRFDTVTDDHIEIAGGDGVMVTNCKFQSGLAVDHAINITGGTNALILNNDLRGTYGTAALADAGTGTDLLDQGNATEGDNRI